MLKLIPLRMFVVAENIGGQVIAAFDDGNIVAFCIVCAGFAQRTLLFALANAGGAE